MRDVSEAGVSPRCHAHCPTHPSKHQTKVHMNRYVLYVVLALLLGGCGQKDEAPGIAEQQVAKALWEQQQAEKNAAIALANQKAAEEKAALEKSSSERVIFGLSVGALMAFFIGIGLGSSSRKTSAASAKVSGG